MSQKKRGELDAHIVFEADEEEFDRMRAWLISTIKEAARYSQKGMVAIGVYEHAEMVAHSVTGTPSSVAQAAIEQAFDIEKKEVAS